MPLDKNMSHEEMVKELIDSYKKTGKIGATEPRDMKHALEIANAVAYNIGESKEVKAIERNVEEMTLDEILESMERIISAKEKELGIFSETKDEKTFDIQAYTESKPIYFKTGKGNILQAQKENGEWYVLGKKVTDNSVISTLEKELGNAVKDNEKTYKDLMSDLEWELWDSGNLSITQQDMLKYMLDSGLVTREPGREGEHDTANGVARWVYHLAEAYGQENPKVKVTLDSGETFETEVDPATSEDELEKQYKAGTEINVGKEGQERKAKIKSATLTKQVGESFDQQSYDMYVEDPDLYDLEMLQDLKQGLMAKAGAWTDNDVAELNAITKRMKELKATNEDLENPLAVIENPTDVISLDIPLLMRLLEWSREQAGEDVDLHVLTENLVEAMKDTEFLTMDDYERLVPCEECNDEEIEECDGSSATTMSGMGVDTLVPMGRKNKVMKPIRYKKSNHIPTPRH